MISIIYGGYFFFGIVMSECIVKVMDHTIIKYENGKELDKLESNLLDSLNLLVKLIGDKKILATVYSFVTLFWFPIIVKIIVEHIIKGNKFWDD
ncbi:hypothetical protein [Halalkalibacter oceani]|uniref:hypothetical protein n=1 Tax=Halalkalibacter oceani TaxID=1653776 RepID=UPI00339727B3